MHWLGYVLGIVVGGTFGFWFHGFWEGDLTGVGSPPPPRFDLVVPVALFVVATAVLAIVVRRRHETGA